MPGRNEPIDPENDSDDEYEREMNELEEDDFANRANYQSDDDNYDDLGPINPSRSRSSRAGGPDLPRRPRAGIPGSDSPDFESFDPASYLRKRGMTYGDPSSSPSAEPYDVVPRRRRAARRDEFEDSGDEGVGGIGGLGGLIGGILRPETLPLLGQYKNSLGPLFRWVVYGLGCLVIFALIGCGAIVLALMRTFGRQ